MPKYSAKQINRAWHLHNDHGYDKHKMADIMGCSCVEAANLIETAKKRFKPLQNFATPEKIPVILDKEIKGKLKRPKAEYSNQRLYDLI